MVTRSCKIEVGGVYGDFAADFSFRKIATLQILWPERLAVQTKSGGGGSGGGTRSVGQVLNESPVDFQSLP